MVHSSQVHRQPCARSHPCNHHAASLGRHHAHAQHLFCGYVGLPLLSSRSPPSGAQPPARSPVVNARTWSGWVVVRVAGSVTIRPLAEDSDTDRPPIRSCTLRSSSPTPPDSIHGPRTSHGTPCLRNSRLPSPPMERYPLFKRENVRKETTKTSSWTLKRRTNSDVSTTHKPHREARPRTPCPTVHQSIGKITFSGDLLLYIWMNHCPRRETELHPRLRPVVTAEAFKMARLQRPGHGSVKRRRRKLDFS